MLGRRIRQRRRELDLTQSQLAEASGVPQFHISAIERGRIREIKSDTLRQLARALRISADWLLELDEKSQESETCPAVEVLVGA